MNDTLRSVFRSLRRRIDVPYVFYDAKKLSNYQNVKRSFTTALDRAKIADFHFHDLRHTFASQLVMAGVDLVAVKELLGHKDIKMTLRYAHLAPAHKRKAVNVLDSLLNTPTSAHPQSTDHELTQELDTPNRKGASPCQLNPLINLGGAEGDRTPDPKTASLVLSQLSYSPMFFLQLRWLM